MATLTRKIGEGTIFLTLQKFGTTFISIITNFFIIKYLGQYQYGLLVLALSVVAFFSTFLDFGLGIVISSDIASYRGQQSFDRVRKLIKDYFFIEVLIGSIICISIITVFVFFGQNTSTIKYLALISSFLLFLIALKNVFLTVIHSFSHFKSLALIQFSEIFVKLILVVIFVALMGKGLLFVIFIHFIASLSAVLIAAFMYVKIVRSLKQYPISKEFMLYNLVKRHGKWQGFYQVLKSTSENLRYWVITFFVGVNGVAVFNVASQIVSHLHKLTSSIESVLIPVLAEELAKGKDLAKKIIDRSVKYSLWLVLIIMFFSSFGVPILLIILFGDKYLLSIPVFLVLLFSLPAMAVSVILRPIFFYLKDQKKLFYLGLHLNLICTPLYILLTYFIGIYGYAFPIADYYGFFLRYKYLAKKDSYYKISLKKIFSWDDYDSTLLAKFKSAFLNKYKKYVSSK